MLLRRSAAATQAALCGNHISISPPVALATSMEASRCLKLPIIITDSSRNQQDVKVGNVHLQIPIAKKF